MSWMIDFVAASPRRDSAEYDELMAETFGSSSDWGDEFRFDRETRRLRSLIIAVPEREGNADELDLWTRAPAIAGTVSPDSVEGYVVSTVETRTLSPDGLALIGRVGAHPPVDAWRLSLSDDLDLLFDGEQYAGWMVSRPLSYLRPWGSEAASVPPVIDSNLIGVVREMLAVLTMETLDELFDDAPEARARLENLVARVAELPSGPPANALRDKLAQLQDNVNDTIAVTKKRGM